MSERPFWLHLAVGAYRRLLRIYPADFRERHAGEMSAFFEARLRRARSENGVWGALRMGLAAGRDLLANGWAERRGHRAEIGPGGSRENDSHAHETKGGGMEAFWKDIAYAMRSLRRSPGFSVVAVLTIALGIGANTAIFSVTRSVLLAPLPYEEPDRLMVLWGEMTNRGVVNFPHSPPDLQDYRELTDVFEGLAGVFTFRQPLTGEYEPQQIEVGGVTPDFFQVLGVTPLLGRDFVPSDGDPQDPNAQPGSPSFVNNSAILSHGLWQRRYGGDPAVLGRIVEVGGNPTEIVGVMPSDFELLMPASAALASDVDIWTALRIDFEAAPRGNVFLRVVGRLLPGVSLERAQADLDRLASDLRAEFQLWETAGFGLQVVPLHEDLTAHVRPVIVALMGAVIFVLLIACANVSNLLLVRATTREREIAVRAALGGSRLRLIRQLVAESVLLALVGAAAGVGLARLGIELLLRLQPEDLPRIESVAIDGTVLLYTAFAAMGAAIVFGLLPTVRASRPDLADTLKDRGHAAGLASGRLLRNGVVVVEVGLSLVLLIGAGLMVRSFVSLQQVDPGFEPEGLLTFGVSLPGGRYPDAEQRKLFMVQLQDRLEGLPGVERASGAFPLPLTDQQFNGRWGLEEALNDPEAFQQADYRGVLPGFFEAMGTRLLAGRGFSEADNLDATEVVVVDEALAEKAFPGGSAVGERILVRARTAEPEWVEVVGVVENQRHASLSEPGRETVFFTDGYLGAFGIMTWALRLNGDPTSMAAAVRTELAALDPQIPMDDMRPMTAYMDEHLAPTRFALILISAFGLVALALASVGLYGVLSYAVRQRTAEIGVRMAFGAETGSILKLVVGQGMALSLAGVLFGLIAALGLTGMLSSLLIEVSATDPLTYVAISLLFLGVAAVACTIPALRASRTDPVVALREE